MNKSKKIIIACSVTAAVALAAGVGGISYAFWSGGQYEVNPATKTATVVAHGLTVVDHNLDTAGAVWMPYDYANQSDNKVNIWKIDLSYNGNPADIGDYYSLRINYDNATDYEMRDCMYFYKQTGAVDAPTAVTAITDEWEKIESMSKPKIIDYVAPADGQTKFSVYVIFDAYKVAQMGKKVKLKISLDHIVYQITNGDFETGDLRGWTYQEGNDDGQILGDNAVSDEDWFWNEHIAYNQGGNYHFDGWAAKNLDGWRATGDTKEGHAYTLKSTTFTLGGSGVISFKMGGRATELWVCRASDNQPIAKYENNKFADLGDNDPVKNFRHVEEGSRLATMTTFYADLSDHLGEDLYIELHDTGIPNGNWGVAFFDDIVTYYAGTTQSVLTEFATKNDIFECECHQNINEIIHIKTATIPWVQAVKKAD